MVLSGGVGIPVAECIWRCPLSLICRVCACLCSSRSFRVKKKENSSATLGSNVSLLQWAIFMMASFDPEFFPVSFFLATFVTPKEFKQQKGK